MNISLTIQRTQVGHPTLALLHIKRPPTRSHCFLIRVSSFSHRRVTAFFYADKGEESQKRDEDKISREFPFLGVWSKLVNVSWNHVVSRCSRGHDKPEVSEEGFRVNEGSSMTIVKVVIGLIGVAVFASTIGGRGANAILFNVQALCLWFAGATKRSFPNARPIYLGQFGAITAAVHNQRFLFDSTMPNLGFIIQGFSRISYLMDVILEQHPISYILLLATFCFALICIGGFFFSRFRSYQQAVEDSIWDAWACVCSSGTHLRERTRSERAIGLMLAIGGLLFYSLLTSTMTAQFKSRMEWLREGAHSEVMEDGHVVICGTNNHLTTVLKQLNKSQELALHDGLTWPRKQTVVLLSEHERKNTEKMVSHVFKDLLQLNILTRSGSLSNTTSFKKVAADKAHSIIILASNGNKYEADAESVLTVLALQPLLEKSAGKLVVEVFNLSTLELLKSSTGLKVNALQNLSSKILVQCSRQRGLVDVYRELLEHDKQVINLRSYPILAGIRYQEVRRGFPGAIVCGLICEGKVNFHPQDHLQLKATDKLLVICPKDGYKKAPKTMLALNSPEAKNPTTSISSRLSAISEHTSLVPHAANQPCKAADWQAGPKERILILGWHPRVTEMILEYDDYVGPGSELIILADTPGEERQRFMNRKISRQLRNIHVIQQVGNPMSRTDLKMAILHPSSKWKMGNSAKNPKNVDNTKRPLSILVIADNTWKLGDKSRPDKQSALALLLAEDVCKQLEVKVASLVAEFVDAELGKQVMNLRPNLTVIGTDEISGLVTAQVAEQCELNDIWTELLNSWGNEIYMKDIRRYIKPGEMAFFAELSERAILYDEVAIGYRMGDKTVINPSKSVPLHFSLGDALVVISEFEYNSKGF